MTLITNATTDLLHREAAAALQRRADELRRLLQGSAGALAPDDVPDVVDFKDVAANDTRAAIDDVTQSHAAAELDQVVAALRRIAEGTYGTCQDCGEAIDARRLRALPATALCTACQEARERAAPPAR